MPLGDDVLETTERSAKAQEAAPHEIDLRASYPGACQNYGPCLDF